MKTTLTKRGIRTFLLDVVDALRSALEWTRTTTPLGTGPQPAAYTIPPRGLTLINYTCILHLSWQFVNGLCTFFCGPSESFCVSFTSQSSRKNFQMVRKKV